MATNLLIGYPDIPLAATSITVSESTDSDTYPPEHLFGGNKTDVFRLPSAGTSPIVIRLDLPSGQTSTCNFAYIGSANLLKNAGVTAVRLLGGSTTNIASGTTVLNITSFSSQTLYGPNSDDIIQKFTTSGSFRYWFIEYTTSASSKIPHSKFFFGNFFDIGIDPNNPATITRIKMGGVQRRPVYSFEITWNGVLYTKAIEMYLKFYKTKRYIPIIIFTDTWHDILMGNRVVFCRITDMSIPPRIADYCDVSVTFEEMP